MFSNICLIMWRYCGQTKINLSGVLSVELPVTQIVTDVPQTQGCRTQSQIALVVFIQKTKSHRERERQRSATGVQNRQIHNALSKKHT